VLPLGVPQMHATLPVRVIEQGMGLMITREHAGFAARSLGAKPFVFAQGAAELPDADMDTLRRSLETGHDQRIRSLVSRQAARAPAWFAGKDWALSFEELAWTVCAAAAEATRGRLARLRLQHEFLEAREIGGQILLARGIDQRALGIEGVLRARDQHRPAAVEAHAQQLERGQPGGLR